MLNLFAGGFLSSVDCLVSLGSSCVYLDDILVFSEMEQQHLHNLCTVLEWLRRENFYAK